MQNQQVYQYYVGLKNKKNQLRWKRRFDIGISFCLLVILFPVMLIISILIATTSEGPILFRQKRVTQYGRIFTIYKFRTMVNDAERLGTLVTTKNDARVTEVGGFLRKYRLDELPQLINILREI
ncbi:MAG: sugar transferase [Clostridia bacterium]